MHHSLLVTCARFSSNSNDPHWRATVAKSLYIVIICDDLLITSSPEGFARYCFHPVCVSLCQSVCVSVCPANILVFYFSDIRRDIDLKFIQDTYRVVLNSLGYRSSHRDGTLLFEGTVVSQKAETKRKISIFFRRHRYSIRWNNKNLREQRNDVTKKYVNIWLEHVKLLYRSYYFS